MLLLAAFAAEPEPQMCCASSVVARNMTYYLRLQRELAKPSGRSVSGLMYGWTPVATKVRDSSLSKDDKAVLDEIAGILNSAKNSKKTKVRSLFPEISKRMIYLSLRHPGGRTALRVAHCPGVGPWLQRPGELASPYEGCGAWSE